MKYFLLHLLRIPFVPSPKAAISRQPQILSQQHGLLLGWTSFLHLPWEILQESPSSTGRTKICWDVSCPGSSSSSQPIPPHQNTPEPTEMPQTQGLHPLLGLQASQHPLSHSSQLLLANTIPKKKRVWEQARHSSSNPASLALRLEPSLRIFRVQAAQLLTNTSSKPGIFQRKTSLGWGLPYRTHIISDYGGAKLNPVYISTALCSKKSPFHLYLAMGKSSSCT